MKWFDKMVASVAPMYAMKRMQVRQRINAYYEAGTPSRLHKKVRDSSDPDENTKPAIEALRIMARNFEQNYDIGRGVLSVLVANTVGEGIKPVPLVKNEGGELAEEFNKSLSVLWEDWIRNPEVTGDFDYYSAQRILAKSLFRDGEVLVQFLEGKVKALDHRSIVPFSIELIEADYLPNDLEDDAKGIVQGVQKNAWGRSKNFYLFKGNPDSTSITNLKDTKRVSADRMLHLKMIDRIRQTRGISVFASLLNRLDDIKEIDENERVAARVAAAMAGYIKKGSPDMYLEPNGGLDYREMGFEPGIIFDDLMMGEEVGTINTTRPNNDLIPFRADQLKAAAAGSQTSYSSISKNYDGTYSAQRQELVEQYAVYGILWSYIKERLARPTWDKFVEMAVAAKLVDTKGIDESTLKDSQHTRPPLTWIDPKKEMDAVEKELAMKITSRSDVIRRRGGDPAEVAKKISEEVKMYKELGIELDPKPEPPASTTTKEPVNADDTSIEGRVLSLCDIEVGDIVQTDDGDYLRKTEDGYEHVTSK